MRTGLLTLALLTLPLAGCIADEIDRPAQTLVCEGIWVEACLLLASPNDSPSKTEIDLAVHPHDPLNVFVASKDLDPMASDCVWSVGQVTKDGGESWRTVYVGGTVGDRADPAHPLHEWDCVTDPIMVFDDEGTLYYALQAYNLLTDGPSPPSPIFADGSAFYLATSPDGGESFPTGRIIPMAFADGTLVFHDYPRMALSPTTGSVSTVWNAVGQAGIDPYVVTTRDGGETVGPPALIASAPATRTTVFFSGYTAGPDGTFYMTILRIAPQDFLLGNFPDRLSPELALSVDDAQSFPTFKPMFPVEPIDCPLAGTETRCGTGLELAADTSGGPFDGRLYAVWEDARHDAADVLVAWTDDAGDTWSEIVRATPFEREQFMARVTVDDRGTVHILHFDRRYEPTSSFFDATWTRSEDGGATWRSERLTSTSFDPDLGIHQDGFPFIGDYNGIGASEGHLYMGFPTTVTGRAEIAVAHVAPSS